jgi:hypothetical protein
MNLNDKALSAIRTGVPYLVGLGISFLIVHTGLSIPDDIKGWLTALLTFGVGYAYYLAVRWAEGKWPQMGWLLGAPVQPVYNPPQVTVPVQPTIINPPNAP